MHWPLCTQGPCEGAGRGGRSSEVKETSAGIPLDVQCQYNAIWGGGGVASISGAVGAQGKD